MSAAESRRPNSRLGPPPASGLASTRPPVFTSTWTRFGGINLHALVSERPRAGDDLILVHGLVLASRSMLPLAVQLTSNFRVWIPDLPGYGLSDRLSRALLIEEQADCLAAWMDLQGLRRAAVLGNSLGCQVAVDLVVRRPELIERLILVAPTGDPHHRRALRLPLRLWPPETGSVGSRPATGMRCTRLLAGSGDAFPSLNRVGICEYASVGARRAFQTIRTGLCHRMEGLLPQITVRSLVVRGIDDVICSQPWAERVASRLPGGRLALVAGAGHTICYNFASELATEVRSFLMEPVA